MLWLAFFVLVLEDNFMYAKVKRSKGKGTKIGVRLIVPKWKSRRIVTNDFN